MSLEVYPVQTGRVRVKESQRTRQFGGLARVFFDDRWTDWLPIYAWLIDHPEGPILVDTGETARAATEPGYFPRWHPYYRFGVEVDMSPYDEIGPRLDEMGIPARDVSRVVMTHLHTDHAGGLAHLRESEIIVDAGELRLATSGTGRMMGYLPHRWPGWFSPTRLRLNGEHTFGPFDSAWKVTAKGDVVLVSTPGHTPHHVSVIVDRMDHLVFLAGDTSYTEGNLQNGTVDGVSMRPSRTRSTMGKILELAAMRPLVYLPSHDPDAASRLADRSTLSPQAILVGDGETDRPDADHVA